MLTAVSNEPSEPIEPIVTEPDWIANWSALVRARAETIKCNSGENMPKAFNRVVNQVLSARKTGITVSEFETNRWLNGHDVPRDAVTNDALLMALNLRYSSESNGHRTIRRAELAGKKTSKGRDPVLEDFESKNAHDQHQIEELIALRVDLLDRYEYALMDAETRPPADPHMTPDGRIQSVQCMGNILRGEKTECAMEERFIPEAVLGRIYDANTHYEELSNMEQQRVLANTPSPAEYLACWRGYLGAAREPLAAEVGIGSTTMLDYEKGHAMPSPSSLQKLRTIFKGQPKAFERYKALIINARALAIDNSIADGDFLRASNHRQDLPREYWREAIRQLMGGEIDDPEAPSWANVVRPIKSQASYFTAIRYAFGKPLNGSIASLTQIPELGLTCDVLQGIESGDHFTPESRAKMVKYFSDLQAERLGNPDANPPIAPYDRFPDTNNKPPLTMRFFDPERFDPASEKYLPIARNRNSRRSSFVETIRNDTAEQASINKM